MVICKGHARKMTALGAASSAGHAEIVRLLTEAGAEKLAVGYSIPLRVYRYI